MNKIHWFLLKPVALFLLLIAFSKGELKAQTGEVCYNPNLVKGTSKKSIKSMAIGAIGNDTVKISYHSPGVRKRVIWGGLVPYDEVTTPGVGIRSKRRYN